MNISFKSLTGYCLLVVATSVLWAMPVSAELLTLPDRDKPTPITTDSVPHVQIGVDAVAEISTELLRRVSNIPGVELRDTVLSLPGARGFWLNENIRLSRPGAIIRGREFAHLHPDGSLHASLSPEVAAMAVRAGWAVKHPWSDQRPGWEGFVMIYTPLTEEELDVVYQLVESSYNFVTGIR